MVSTHKDSLHLCAGDWVEVRSREEILLTLDQHGQLDHLPFMPEMLQYCGERFRVSKRAHKTCDSVNKTGARRMVRAVHLEGLRCDGQAHGGCEARCLLFWKEDWLRPVDQPAAPTPSTSPAGCTEQQLWAATKASDQQSPNDLTYVCQATQIPAATLPLKGTDLGQYVEDYTSGNTSLGRILASFCFCFYRWVMNLGIGLGRPMRCGYDLFQRSIGGVPYPFRPGKVPPGSRTPSIDLNLQPGDWVRVKSHAEVLQTLDTGGMNRGMLFNQELVPYCGKIFRVGGRVSKIINERTGRMLPMKSSCIILEGVECEARYVERQLFCPRGTYHFWHEIWLERVDKPACAAAASGGCPLARA